MDNTPFFSREENLSHLLIHCGQRLGVRHGTHRSQGRILRILYLNGPMTQKELQEKLDIQPGSMSEIAAKLENRGLVSREKDPADKRKIFLSLTDEGRRDVEEHRLARQERQRKNFSHLSEEEKDTLEALLTRLLDAWQEDNQEKEHHHHGEHHRKDHHDPKERP